MAGRLRRAPSPTRSGGATATSPPDWEDESGGPEPSKTRRQQSVRVQALRRRREEARERTLAQAAGAVNGLGYAGPEKAR